MTNEQPPEKPRKTFREALAELDWNGPVTEFVYTVYLLLLDAAAIVALMVIALVLKKVLTSFEMPPIVIAGHQIGADQFIKNYDYALLFLFLVAQFVKMARSLFRS